MTEPIADGVQPTPSRYGTFLGYSENDASHKIVDDLLVLIKESLLANPDYIDREILLKIVDDLSDGKISTMVNVDGSVRFTVSRQEVEWLEKHDRALWVEYIAYRYKFKIYPRIKKLIDFPLHLLIEATPICNLKCVMCFQVDNVFKTRDYMGRMPFEFFVNLVDQAKENHCHAITLGSRGEPTLHPKFGAMLQHLSERGILDIKINTNATRLSEKLCHDILAANVSEVVFSVDAGTKQTYEEIRVGAEFETVVANIDRFNKIRATQYSKATAVTRVTGIKVREDQDLDQMYRHWSQYVDQVTMKNAIPRWDSYHNAVNDIKESCLLLWEKLYVWYDGTANPCDFDYKSHLKVGDAKTQSLRDIWLGEPFQKLRQAHIEKRRKGVFPCDRCPSN